MSQSHWFVFCRNCNLVLKSNSSFLFCDATEAQSALERLKSLLPADIEQENQLEQVSSNIKNWFSRGRTKKLKYNVPSSKRASLAGEAFPINPLMQRAHCLNRTRNFQLQTRITKQWPRLDRTEAIHGPTVIMASSSLRPEHLMLTDLFEGLQPKSTLGFGTQSLT